MPKDISKKLKHKVSNNKLFGSLIIAVRIIFPSCFLFFGHISHQ